MAVMTLVALRAELDADPKALGYALLWTQSNGPEAVAARLNEANTVPADTIFKSYVTMEDFLAEIVLADYNALTAAQKTALDQFARGTRIKTGSANMRATIGALFPASATRTALIALASRAASRAEVLWGENARVTDVQVADAKAL